MTKSEIDTITACEATNILLAENVMLSARPLNRPKSIVDCKTIQSPSGAWFYSVSNGWQVQNFSGDIDAAMMIAEKIQERFCGFSEIVGLNLIHLEKDLWAATFSLNSDELWYEQEHLNRHLAAATGETASLAIARAALKVVCGL